MARKKFKMTGFARFFIVMLILAPLAYIGASYANGQDGIENFKDLFKGKISMGNNSEASTDTKEVEIPTPAPKQETSTTDTNSDALKVKDKKIKLLEERNEVLKELLDEKSDELMETKLKLKTVESELSAIQEAKNGE